MGPSLASTGLLPSGVLGIPGTGGALGDPGGSHPEACINQPRAAAARTPRLCMAILGIFVPGGFCLKKKKNHTSIQPPCFTERET